MPDYPSPAEASPLALSAIGERFVLHWGEMGARWGVNRTVAQIGRNLLEGAAVITRVQQLRACGVSVPAVAFDFRPRRLA